MTQITSYKYPKIISAPKWYDEQSFGKSYITLKTSEIIFSGQRLKRNKIDSPVYIVIGSHKKDIILQREDMYPVNINNFKEEDILLEIFRSSLFQK